MAVCVLTSFLKLMENQMKILFISLGCDKNLVDSEYMLGMIAEEQIELTDNEAEADIIIINTCCFIGDAKEESINTILEMAKYKETGKLKGLIVTGCLAQRYKEEIEKELPEVDALIGTNSCHHIVEAIREVASGRRYRRFDTLEGLPGLFKKRSVTTGGHYAYLKIAEGCDKHCTYCIIPAIRGSYRSIPMEDLVKRAKGLVSMGVKELILIAQETTVYGMDLYGHKALGGLLDRLNGIGELRWIRILYCYPEEIDDTLIDAILRNDKVCHYLDIPIQHSADSILRRMGRKTSHDDIVALIKKLRKRIPDICIRTTLISGFPGETDKMHEEMAEFVNEMEFDRLGVFVYSLEEGTPAEQFPDQVDEEVKLARKEEIMELQREVSYENNEVLRGKVLTAFVEGKVADENVYVGRTYRDAPGVDGYVFIHTGKELMTGEFVEVKITGVYEYDLIGELMDEPSE